jgi:hypothetical protein
MEPSGQPVTIAPAVGNPNGSRSVSSICHAFPALATIVSASVASRRSLEGLRRRFVGDVATDPVGVRCASKSSWICWRSDSRGGRSSHIVSCHSAAALEF